MGAREARIALIAALAIGCGPAVAASDAGFSIREVAPGVFVHPGRNLPLAAPGHDDIANIGFIAGTRCAAVIDSGGSVRVGAALRAALEARTSVPICYVIDTHVHVDHVLGNAAFAPDRPQFWGHAALAQDMQRNRDFFLEEYAADLAALPPGAAKIIGPDHTVADTATLDLGGRSLILRAWPEAHTDCDLTVLDSATRTLFTGDLLFRGRLPALDGSLRGWLRVIDELGGLQAAVVVPGHGAVTRDLAAALAPERRYLSQLAGDVRSSIRRGESLRETTLHAAAAERGRWLLWDSVHPGNVIRAYQELEWE